MTESLKQCRESRQRQFIEYQGPDAFYDAYVWALQEMTRKYPGAAGNLKHLDAMIEQKLEGER